MSCGDHLPKGRPVNRKLRILVPVSFFALRAGYALPSSAGPLFLPLEMPTVEEWREDVVIDARADCVWQRAGHQAGKPTHAGKFFPDRDEGGQAGELCAALADMQALEGCLRGQGPIREAVAGDRGEAERRAGLVGAVLVMGDLHPANGAVRVVEHFDLVRRFHRQRDSARGRGTSPLRLDGAGRSG